jgi:N-acetylglutamate synthase-like GNAT family acetyltransferase
MNNVPPVVIAQANLLDLRPLNRLFRAAVRQHFGYFPLAVQNRVIAQHDLMRLGRAIVHPSRVVLVARHAGRIIGYAIGAVPRSKVGQFNWLYVEPSYRGHRTGLQLTNQMIQQQRRRGATVMYLATHNHQPYYERQGFNVINRQEVDGVAMTVMCRPLEAV